MSQGRCHRDPLAVPGAVAAVEKADDVLHVALEVVRIPGLPAQELGLEPELPGQHGTERLPFGGDHQARHHPARVLRRGFAGSPEVFPAGACRRGSGLAGAAKSQIDPVREHCRQGSDVFGYLQRPVVAQDGGSRPHPDGPGGGSNQGGQHMRGGTRDAGIEMVLGQPIAVVAEVLGSDGQLHAVAQRLPGVHPRRDGAQIEN
ncbi:hypothetical protein ASF72_03505 [Arthrobacter sp. Leaf141]|nr:hypothetical protein ASF72_03505 [Arthrobacter sp. Leaf141]